MNTIVEFSVLKDIVSSAKSLFAGKASGVCLDLNGGGAMVWGDGYAHAFLTVPRVPGAPVRVYGGQAFAAVVRKLAKVFKPADQVGIDDTGIGGVALRESGTQPPAFVRAPTENTVPVTVPAIPVGSFISHLASVAAASNTDGTRPSLNGVLLSYDPARGLLFVATDGYRLHTATHSIDKAEAPGNVFIPAVLVDVILNTFKGVKPGCGPLVHAWRDGGCKVLIDDRHFIDIDAKQSFPAWERAIPAASAYTNAVDIDTAESRNLARLAKMITTGRVLGAHARMTIDQGGQTINLDSVQGHGKVTAACPSMRGRGAATLGVNLAYLTEAIAHLTAPGFGPVTIRWIDEWSPIVFESPGRTAVVMPVRV